MTAPILILACGNPSRGDDALGPQLAARLETWLAEVGLDKQIEVICDLQFQIEQAADLAQRQHVLFIDAACQLSRLCEYQRLSPAEDRTLTSHATSPAGILWIASRLLALPLPECGLLRVAAYRFELGENLTYPAQRAMAAAWVALRNWCLQSCQEHLACTN